jgi:cytidyltransferase-like protein
MIVYTGGTFDVPHLGHVNFFNQCKGLFPDSTLIVALNTDDFITKFKGKPPLFSYAERVSFLNLIPVIDSIVPNIGGADSKITIKLYLPDVIAIGNDWLEKDYCAQMNFDAQWLTDNKISLIYIPHTDGISTSLIKERFSNGY